MLPYLMFPTLERYSCITVSRIPPFKGLVLPGPVLARDRLAYREIRRLRICATIVSNTGTITI